MSLGLIAWKTLTPASGIAAAAASGVPWTAILSVVGVVAVAWITNVVGQRVAGSTGRSASAQEVTAMGERLDKQSAQIEAQSRRIEELYRDNRLLRDALYRCIRAIGSGEQVDVDELEGLL